MIPREEQYVLGRQLGGSRSTLLLALGTNTWIRTAAANLTTVYCIALYGQQGPYSGCIIMVLGITKSSNGMYGDKRGTICYKE